MVAKTHSTNYFDTFIEVAEDCPAKVGETPPHTEAGTVASLQFDMLHSHPYAHTSDEVLFAVFAARNGISKRDLGRERAGFFSKGQPCFRSSPLSKRYGWGVHSNAQGEIAIYPVESTEYKKLVMDKRVKHLKAMRSKRV